MLSKEQIWEQIDHLIEPLGLKIFDLDLPGPSSKVMRVFLSRIGASNIGAGASGNSLSGNSLSGTAQGVLLDECARASKLIENSPEFEDLFSESSALEVSSPGVNRRLTRPEHFEGAIGERVKLTVTSFKGSRNNAVRSAKETVRGTLRGFDGETLQVDDEQSHAAVEIPLSQVHDARVDFLF
jgi:ribosome maturation factor RimP